MTSNTFVNAPCTALALLLSTVALAQEPATMTKIPRPLSAVPDIKTASEPYPVLPFDPPVLKLASPPRGLPSDPPSGLAGDALENPIVGARAPIDRSQVYFDEPGDGQVWARGATYKAGFGQDGAVYVPFFGAQAPASHPIAFTLESVALDGLELEYERAASPVREHASVSFDRGAFVERYDLAPDSVEQSLVFASLPARGELVVHVGVETDIDFAAANGGFEFSHELGRVTYGRATVLDGAGRSLELESRRAGAAIEIRVPAEFLDAAVWPVTIDPVISTFAVDTTGTDNWLPSVAYDVTTDRYLAVHEERFSSTDYDIFATVLSGTGTNLGGNYVDATVTMWRAPDVANNNLANQFLVVCTVGDPAADRSIRGRTWAAATSAQSAALTISDGYFGDKYQAKVGGDPTLTAPTYYCVAWIRELSSDGDVHCRLVRSDGTLVGTLTQLIDNTDGNDINLDVSKSNGGEPSANQVWNVAWQRFLSVGVSDLHGAQIAWDGVVATPSFAIDTTVNDDYYPSASSPHDAATGDRQWIVAFSRPVGSDYDTMVRFLTGSVMGPITNLSALESVAGSGTVSEDQLRPSVDCDGSRFVIGYEESTPANLVNTYIATLDFVNSYVFLREGHRALGTSSSSEEYLDLTSRHGAGSTNGTFMAVWTRLATSSWDIYGGLYSTPAFQAFCLPGQDASACPCFNAPVSSGRGCNNSGNTGGAVLSGAGVASLASDSVTLTSTGELPTALSIFNQGDGFANAVFGQGRRCVGGALKRLYTKSAIGGAASAPSGSDPSVSARSAALGDPIPAGAARYYYVYYRDPVVLGGCPSTSTFNTTQALQTMWAP